TSAATITISAALSDLNNIAAASAPDSPGDGSNALALAQLRTAQVMNGGTATFNEFYGAFVATIGNLVDDANAQVNDYQLLTDYLTSQQQSVSGVSLDEEAANLVKYQRAYEAAARVLTALDEMADTIINRMGVVGR
ncbi:MAG: flagellar hook-associated protein FlgK, partial [Chloroflexota bacterium]